MFWIILLFIFLLIVIAIKPFLRRNGRSVDFSLYRKKDRVMNESEQALFINLQKTLGDRYIVLSKVRIEDFVEATHGIGGYGARGRIKSRHVDFLICDRATTKPLLAVELDGKSHQGEDRQKRDRFVDELYKTIGLPIRHIPVGSNFSECAQEINEALKNFGYTAESIVGILD
ncbi:MAG: DUF2726 domain-containing protein [Candidatus Moraniibacteriota bacterium]|nr:MAG: DUF2726 domain-containing protein [Candidatus Moranbacteria bacterium]